LLYSDVFNREASHVGVQYFSLYVSREKDNLYGHIHDILYFDFLL
jgi:hypothetical protein